MDIYLLFISIFTSVACYQGFYCLKSGRKTVPKRCPGGTFSPNKNGTSIEDCLSCPKDTNKRKRWMRRMERKTIQMFQTNCYTSLLSQTQGKASIVQTCFLLSLSNWLCHGLALRDKDLRLASWIIPIFKSSSSFVSKNFICSQMKRRDLQVWELLS